jgi:hypothetical protein
MAKDVGFKAKTRKKKTAPEQSALEIGDTGTRILSGYISEEYNSKLIGTAGVAIYDEMRKSDGTVRAVVQAVTLPIRAANWFVKPASEDQADQDIASFVDDCLFEYSTISYPDFLRQALLSLVFGVMAFEKVYTTREVDGQTRIVWSKLAPRLPRSIQKWEIKDGAFGITQTRSDGVTAEIPGDRLLLFINEIEGENWWGTSILRAAYKPWFMKSTLEKIDAIAHERQGIGVPKITLPDGATKSDVTKAEDIAKNMRANHQAYAIQPDGYSIEFMDMKASTTRDTSNSLAYHSREIMKSALAQFLELGSTNAGGTGGSRALSQDHSDLFMLSLETVARWFAGVMSKDAIRELVDLNFDNVSKYPTLDFEGITEADVKAIADTYASLVTSGAVTPQDADEAYFRELNDFPELDESGIREKAPAPTEIDPNNPDPAQASERLLKKKPSAFSDGPFKPSRKLTFAEDKVDFDAIQEKMNALEDQFDSATKALLHQARDAYMAALTKAAHANDTQAIKDATLKVQQDYARILKQAMQNAFTYGKNNAAKEIGVDAPGNPADTLRQIDIQANAIADQHISKITADSKNAYVQSLSKGDSLTAALGAADAAAADAIDTLTSDATAVLMAGYINNGRGTVFDKNADDIYALQRSELLDRATCNYCISVDGRIVEKDDPFAQNNIFHSNCRGIWVAILQDEEDKPAIGGIPKSLRDRFGDAVNDLVQPKNPTPKKR